MYFDEKVIEIGSLNSIDTDLSSSLSSIEPDDGLMVIEPFPESPLAENLIPSLITSIVT